MLACEILFELLQISVLSLPDNEVGPLSALSNSSIGPRCPPKQAVKSSNGLLQALSVNGASLD